MGSSLSANAIVIIAVIIVVAAAIVIRFVLKKAAYKASDAIRNKMIDKNEEKNPPQQENLTDRFKNEM